MEQARNNGRPLISLRRVKGHGIHYVKSGKMRFKGVYRTITTVICCFIPSCLLFLFIYSFIGTTLPGAVYLSFVTEVGFDDVSEEEVMCVENNQIYHWFHPMYYCVYTTQTFSISFLHSFSLSFCLSVSGTGSVDLPLPVCLSVCLFSPSFSFVFFFKGYVEYFFFLSVRKCYPISIADRPGKTVLVRYGL